MGGTTIRIHKFWTEKNCCSACEHPAPALDVPTLPSLADSQLPFRLWFLVPSIGTMRLSSPSLLPIRHHLRQTTEFCNSIPVSAFAMNLFIYAVSVIFLPCFDRICFSRKQPPQDHGGAKFTFTRRIPMLLWKRPFWQRHCHLFPERRSTSISNTLRTGIPTAFLDACWALGSFINHLNCILLAWVLRVPPVKRNSSKGKTERLGISSVVPRNQNISTLCPIFSLKIQSKTCRKNLFLDVWKCTGNSRSPSAGALPDTAHSSPHYPPGLNTSCYPSQEPDVRLVPMCHS